MYTQDKQILLTAFLLGIIGGFITYFLLGGTQVMNVIRIGIWFSLIHIPFIAIARFTSWKKFLFVPVLLVVIFELVYGGFYLFGLRDPGSWGDLIYVVFLVYGTLFALISLFINLFIYRKIIANKPFIQNPRLIIDIVALLLSSFMIFSYYRFLTEMSINLAPAYYLFILFSSLILGLVLFIVMNYRFYYYKLLLAIIPLIYVIIFNLTNIQDISLVFVSSFTTIVYILLSNFKGTKKSTSKDRVNS